MRTVVIGLFFACVASTASAQNASCKAQGVEKKTRRRRARELHQEVRARSCDRVRRFGKGQEAGRRRESELYEEVRRGRSRNLG